MMSSSPGIVAVFHFSQPKNKQYTGYINYMNRPEAMRDEHFKEWNTVNLDGYNRYMENPEKSFGLFTKSLRKMNQDQRTALKKQFIEAQQNHSIMWQTVVSFDNAFLAEHHLYDPDTKQVDQPKLQDAIRAGMDKLLKNEGLDATAIWSAAIHLNTDNIHIHIATVEPEPHREFKVLADGTETNKRKGMFKRDSMSKLKSAVAGQLFNRSESLAKISQLVRVGLPEHDQPWGELKDRDLIDLYREIRNRLPDDMRKWKYNMNALKEVRPYIDAFSATYMQRYRPDELNELGDALKNETVFRAALYGKGQEGKELDRAKDYTTGKYEELYAKMGNSILSEMRRNELADRKQVHQEYQARREQWEKNAAAPSGPGILRAVNSLKPLLRGDVKQRILAQRDYEATEQEEERKRDQSQGPELGY